MEQGRWTKYLEISSNVAVLVVAVMLLAMLVSARFGQPGKQTFAKGLEKGQVLAPLPSLKYSAAPQTVLLALSTTCSYCKESLPFYRRLIQEQFKAGSRTPIVAVFPNSETDVEKYKQQNQLNIQSVAAVDSSIVKVAGTPTLILIDADGRVRDFWVGLLSSDEEQQVLSALQGK